MTDTGFGIFNGNVALALAELRAAEAALNFVRQGLTDPTGRKPEVAFDIFEMQVKVRLLEAASGGGVVPQPEKLANTWHANAWPESLKAANISLLIAYSETARRHNITLIAPWLGITGKEDERQIALDVIGAAPLDRPNDDDPLALARKMALFNAQRSEQRLSLLYVLADIPPGSASNMPVEAAEEQFSSASRLLWQERHQHLAKALALGALIGGEALKSNKSLAKEMFGHTMSIIELIEVDGRQPAGYSASTEQGLRDAIFNA